MHQLLFCNGRTKSYLRGLRGRDHMVIGSMNTNGISAYRH